jgi:hypothetical protein
VPFELNIDTSGGNPTKTGACASVIPFRNNRRGTRVLVVITLAMVDQF